MEKLLFIFIFILILSYIGYPILLSVISLFACSEVKEDDSYRPTVSMLIAAYNEGETIAEKIENSLLLDYPKDKFEIVVVSDGSTDKTDEIVLSYAHKGVKLFRVEGRVGKTEARNRAVLASRSEVILFSDATAIYERGAVKALVRKLADPTVGMVSGSLRYFDRKTATMGIATKIYWEYESFIKRAQGRMHTMTGAVGCINAFKRKLYHVLPPNIIEDFTEPLMIISQGYRVAYSEDAISYERTTQVPKQEFNMRVRVIRGGMTGFLYALRSLNFKKHSYSIVQLFLHKVLRWMMPLFLMAILILSFALFLTKDEVGYEYFFYLQLFFYVWAIFGLFFKTDNKIAKILSIPTYFLIVNLACLKAMYLTMTTKLAATWETNVY